MDPTSSDDFWKWSDTQDSLTEHKARALGISPEFFSSDLHYSLGASDLICAEDDRILKMIVRQLCKKANKRKAQRRARCGRRRK